MTASPNSARFIEVAGQSLHCLRLPGDPSTSPLVFLHEGLGSVELWRDFPADVVMATERSGLVYSRLGHGWSEPLKGRRRPDYMHTEALTVLPRVVDLEVDDPPILVGHSDGASIALIYAGAGNPVAGLVLIAPHVFVEPETVRSIRAIRDRFPDSDMAEKLGRYHADPEGTFYGWADVWLSPAFRSWNIEEYLGGVSCPTLMVQGDADEYGTFGQLDAIEATVAGPTERLVVPGAAHSPHLSHGEPVESAVTSFVGNLS